MTTITIGTHRPNSSTLWIAATAAALLLAGLVVGLVLAFSGSSGGTSTPPSSGPIERTSGGASNPVAPAARCPGSLKDWTC